MHERDHRERNHLRVSAHGGILQRRLGLPSNRLWQTQTLVMARASGHKASQPQDLHARHPRKAEADERVEVSDRETQDRHMPRGACYTETASSSANAIYCQSLEIQAGGWRYEKEQAGKKSRKRREAAEKGRRRPGTRQAGAGRKGGGEGVSTERRGQQGKGKAKPCREKQDRQRGRCDDHRCIRKRREEAPWGCVTKQRHGQPSHRRDCVAASGSLARHAHS